MYTAWIINLRKISKSMHQRKFSLSGKVPCRLVKFNYNFKDFGIYCVLSLKFLAKLLKNNYVYIFQSKLFTVRMLCPCVWCCIDMQGQPGTSHETVNERILNGL